MNIAKKPQTDVDILHYINQTKEFWKVTDFQKEILDFEGFTPHIPDDLNFYIGHPEMAVDYRSDRGTSFGDIIPYTRLPELLKIYYRGCKVFIPKWFIDVFQHNPYIDGTHDFDYKWGSMGTFGTTIQRCTNVWGLRTEDYTPKLFASPNIKKRKNTILFTLNSKTGGRFGDNDLLEEVVEHLGKKYHCVQLGLSDDYLVKSAHKHVLNISRNKLIDFVAEFPIYIGAQSSIYHIAKGLGLKTIGILPEKQRLKEAGSVQTIFGGFHPDYVQLPLLTVTNTMEVVPCGEEHFERAKYFQPMFPNQPPNGGAGENSIAGYNDTIAHLGWLYPDTPHLTMSPLGTERCPTLSKETIDMALNDEIYPFNDDRLWDYYKHKELWTAPNTDPLNIAKGFSTVLKKEKPKIISSHIPRTGGNLFRNVLYDLYGVRDCLENVKDKIYYDEKYFTRKGDMVMYEDYGDKPEYNYYEVNPTVDVPQYECIHGHFRLGKYKQLFNSHKLIVWLRNPIDRLISHYYFLKNSPLHIDPIQNKLIAEELDLYQFCELETSKNIYKKYFQKYSKNIDFIGITESYNDSLRKFEKMFDVEVGDTYPYFDIESGDSDFKNNIQNSKWAVYKKEYDKIDRNFIKKLNQDDIEIYNQSVRINSEYKL
mgnify:FL=1|tara:strand:- start:6647 stop:8593 length:1947 start_codon:yes stop_codon:yes gene_type:complete